MEEKRQLTHGLLDRVIVSREPTVAADTAVRKGERTQIVLRGNVLLGPKPDDEVLGSDRC